MSAPDIPRTREQLVHMLTHAAETEHMLCCQYLYAAFSLKHRTEDGLSYEQQRMTHGWAQLIFLIARQEMEHLGLANNVLTAVGGSPHFSRPNFPQGRSYYPTDMALTKFSLETIDRFIAYETPSPPPSEPSNDDGSDMSSYVPVKFTTIEELYDHISWLIDNIPMSDTELFLGARDGQVDGELLHLDWPRPGALGGIFDTTLFPVTDRASAHRAIDLIIAQGEGTPDEHEFTHFKWFTEMRQELSDQLEKDPEFEPAFDVPTNPSLWQRPGLDSGSLITDPVAREVASLADGVYSLLLLLLARTYAYTDIAPAFDYQGAGATGATYGNDVVALQYTLFPLMTQAFRPVCEVLIGLPARADGSGRAAPSFDLDGPVAMLPHRDAAFAYLAERFFELSAAAIQIGEAHEATSRLAYIGSNLAIMGNKMTDIAAGTYPEPLMKPGVIVPGARPATMGGGQ